MNKDNAKDYLPLVQALAEGKVIQRKISESFWDDVIETDFSYEPDRYRIKPEPRKAWVWWPDPDMTHCGVTAFERKAEAEEAKQYWQGRGHITEVTE